MTISLVDAAQARAAGTAQRSHRPRERRCAEQPGSNVRQRTSPVRLSAVTLREAGDSSTVAFSGIASATEQGYEMYDAFGPYTEVVSRGAFGRTLASPGLDVPLVLAHDSLRRIARTTNGSLLLAETEDGLAVDAPSLDMRDADVAYIVPKLRAGLIDEMSFAFMITAGSWSPDYSEFRIHEVDINRGDVAIVGYGANPHTSGNLRAQIRARLSSRALDPEDVNMLTQALGWFTALDSIVDEAQESLAAYLKVPDPDAEDEMGADRAGAKGMTRETLLSYLD